MKFPPWWGYGYFLELHNAEQEHEGELLSMMICTSMWNLKTIGEFGSEFTAVFLQWTHSAGVIQCPALGKDIHVHV